MNGGKSCMEALGGGMKKRLMDQVVNKPKFQVKEGEGGI
jgi:hypothetical protein